MIILFFIFVILFVVWIINKIMVYLYLVHDMNFFGKILYQCLHICGTVYIKIGQMLSNRPDIFNSDILKELKLLQDNVKVSQICHINENFDISEKNLIATGTIAQVYIINYHGKKAVIKIKRLGIEQEIITECKNITFMAKLLKNSIYFLPFLNINILTNYHSIDNLIMSIQNILISQLDFRKEAANIKLFGKHFKDNKYILIPKVFKYEKDYIIMEYLEGKKIDLKNKENNIETNNKLFQILLEFNLVSCFGYNLCHGDMHMGNVLLSKENKIIVLDYGIVFNCTSFEVKQYLQLVSGIAFLDIKKCADVLINYCAANNTHCLNNYQSFKLDIDINLTKIHNSGDMNAVEILNFATNILYKYKTSLKIPMLNLLLSMIIAEGTIKELSPKINFWKSVQSIFTNLSFNNKHIKNDGWKENKKELINTFKKISVYRVLNNNSNCLQFKIEGNLENPFELYYDMITDNHYILKRLKRFSEKIISENPIVIKRKYILKTKYFEMKEYEFEEEWNILIKNENHLEIHSEILNNANTNNLGKIKGFKKIVIKNDKQDTYLSGIINYQIEDNQFLKTLIMSKCIDILRKLIKF